MAENRKAKYMDFGISSMEMIPAYLTGTEEDVVDALAISREYAKEAKLDDNDSVEDSLRHILFGGLIYGDPESEGFIGRNQRKFAGYLADLKEGKDPESLIDINNNEFGRKLRQQYPNREEFISKAKEIANSLAKGEKPPEIDGMTVEKSYGSLTKEEIDRLTQESAEMNSGGLMRNEYNRGGDVIKTEAGEKMKKENPNKALPEKADINKDGEFQEWEKARHEAIKAAQAEDKAEMNMGGLMSDHPMMKMVVGIEKESGNEIPAGSLPEEVADDIPAMLSEGEYVVPADVVRWHGVKTFEELRCEAKMGMGLMAHDGRIAEVDDETRLPVENEIEEDDKPEVEKAKVKVIEANEGTFVTPQAPFYRYESRLNPVTNRYEFVPVDATTGQAITQETFEQAKSTRYTPQTVLDLASGKDTECPEGFYFDEEAGVCMPTTSRGAGSGSGFAFVDSPLYNDGDSGSVEDPAGRVDYASQPATVLAEFLGPLSAKDLEGVEGTTLSEKAVNRMTTEARPVTFAGGPLGFAISVFQNIYDDVGARRAAATRANELTTDPLGIQAYNFNFNPQTGSFSPTSPSTQITETQSGQGGAGWATDYNNVGASGREYSSSEVFSSDAAFGDVMDAIDNDFDNMTAVSGGSFSASPSGVSVSVTTSDGLSSTVSTSDLGGSGGFTGSRGVDANVGPGGQRSGGGGGGSSSSSSSTGGRGGSGRDAGQSGPSAGDPGGGGGGGGGSSSGGTFICTAAYHTGLTSDYIWSANKRFGVSIRKHDPYLYKGYELFGPWVAEKIKQGKFKAFAELTPQIWAYEQAKNTHGNVADFPAHIKVLSHVYKYTTRPVIRILGWVKEKLK